VVTESWGRIADWSDGSGREVNVGGGDRGGRPFLGGLLSGFGGMVITVVMS
jgi:hypothetical protein